MHAGAADTAFGRVLSAVDGLAPEAESEPVAQSTKSVFPPQKETVTAEGGTWYGLSSSGESMPPLDTTFANDDTSQSAFIKEEHPARKMRTETLVKKASPIASP